METERVAPAPQARTWARIDDYLVAMARERNARRRFRPTPRTQPEAPRLLLSTLPFVALAVALGVLAFAMIVAAWPSAEPAERTPQVQGEPRTQAAARPRGTAAPGWFDAAKQEMQ